MKASPRRHCDIQYVNFSCLPEDQVHSLRDWLPESQVFRIDAGGREVDGCIEYEDYEFWYEYIRQEDSFSGLL